MIISKSPLRITLGGGGTDLAQGGRCINAAINLYTYVAINHIWESIYSLKYSDNERAVDRADIKHALFRRILTDRDIPPGIEITTMSDVPTNSGLGSSGSFTVGLLRALDPDAHLLTIARDAGRLDRGLQDQYAATYGGLRIWDFGQTITSRVLPIPQFFFGLALYDTGMRRDADEALTHPRPPHTLLRQQCNDMIGAIENPTKFADCLNAQWAAKFDVDPNPVHRYIDFQIRELRKNGAWGAKLVGAGSGGMILAFGTDHIQSDLRRIPIKVDEEGTRIL